MSETLLALCADIFGIRPEDLQEDSSPESVGTWDSLNNLRLVTAIEEEFSIRFSMREMETLRTIGDIDAAVKEKVGSL